MSQLPPATNSIFVACNACDETGENEDGTECEACEGAGWTLEAVR